MLPTPLQIERDVVADDRRKNVVTHVSGLPDILDVSYRLRAERGDWIAMSEISSVS